MFKINKTVFLTAVHGNELIGLRVLKSLAKTLNISWLVGNPKALKERKRYIDVDLNRVAPGRQYSKFYEYRRAYLLVRKLMKYQQVIDIHDTVSNTGIFVIVTKPTKKNLLLARSLAIKRVVIWYQRSNKKYGPITRYLNSAVAIECGPRNKATENQLNSILIKIIKSKVRIKSQRVFRVYGKLLLSEIRKQDRYRFKNFRKVKFKGEEFFPIMIGQYKAIFCYKMKKLNKN